MAAEEELWRKRLLDEEVTPPASVWQGIEAELDRSKRRKGFFWLFRIGGGIAAVLTLVGLGVWLPEVIRSSADSPKVDAVVSSSEAKDYPSTDRAPRSTTPLSAERVASRHVGRQYPSRSVEKSTVVEIIAASQPTSILSSGHLANPDVVASLENLEFRWYKNRFQWNRPRLAVPSFAAEDTEVKSNTTEKYLAFQTSGAPFQPGVQWPSLAQDAFAAVRETLQDDMPFFSTSGNRSPLPVERVDEMGIASVYDPNSLRPEQSFESGWVMQWSTNFGWFLTERWGVEVGLRYIQGANSTQSNVFSWNTQTAETQTFFEATVLQNKVQNASIIASRESLQSRYHLVSLPIQAVYRIPLNSSWEIAASGGFALDKMVVNQWTWANQSTEQIYRPEESSYRPASVSALGSVRVGRSLGTHWQANAGIFTQYAMSSWLSSEQVSMRPHQWGGQLGITYRWP